MYGLLQAPADAGVEMDGPLEALPCMAAVVVDGVLAGMNSLLKTAGGIYGGATALEDLLPGFDCCGAMGRRLRVDAMLAGRAGPAVGVSVAAQGCVWAGRAGVLILLMEKLNVPSTLVSGGTLLEDVLEATPEATVIAHDGRVLHVNHEFTRMFGYGPAECVGQELDGLVLPEGLLADNEVIFHDLEVEGRSSIETRRRVRSGETIDVSVLVSKVRLGGEAPGLMVTYRDISKQKREEARLQFNALHDGLTGLANRALFLDRLMLTMARLRRRPDRGFAVVFLDLDGFKAVNDSFGHAGGDELLMVIGQRLVQCLRPQDTVARFGGDEFALLLDESGDVTEVERVSLRILVEITTVVELKGQQARVSASLGIVLGNRGYASADDLMRDADEAMYAAKARGKARYVVFGEGLAAA